MNRFPYLDSYRNFMIGIAGLTISIGFVAAIAVSRNPYTKEFSLAAFLLVFGGSILSALIYVIISEVIKVVLNIEDRLEIIEQTQQRLLHTMTVAAIAPNSEARELKTLASAQEITVMGPNLESSVTGTVIVERALVVKQPNTKSLYRILLKATTVNLYGRSSDSKWVQLDSDGNEWVDVAHLRINGDLSELPVTHA